MCVCVREREKGGGGRELNVCVNGEREGGCV